MAVASGMGLSFVHDAVFDRAVPIRAEVVAPTPVLTRADRIQTDTIPAQSVDVVLASATGDIGATQVTTLRDVAVATAVPLQPAQEPTLSTLGPGLHAAPIQSLRPQMRTAPFVQTRTARLSPRITRNRAGTARNQRAPSPAGQTPVTRSVNVYTTPVDLSDRTLPPKVLIGVYR